MSDMSADATYSLINFIVNAIFVLSEELGKLSYGNTELNFDYLKSVVSKLIKA